MSTQTMVVGGLMLMALGAGSGNLLLDWSRLEGLQMPDRCRSRRVTRLIGVGPGETATLCEIKSAGCIQHIWMTLGENNYRNLILRMYWDGEADPSVEAPITDLLGLGHNQRYADLSTPVLTVSPNNGLNLYFPMPFASRARITLTNDNDTPVDGAVYFQADYAEFAELPQGSLRFHAQWRRDNPALRRAKFYTIAEAVGRGYFIGTTYHIRVRDQADAWFHGGGDQMLIDGGTPEADALHGIGGEDFFGASWGIREFQTPYCGCTVNGERISMYRFFLESPLRFEHNLRASFGAMANDITSVGYWYQAEPHHRFFRLPPPAGRQPENDVAASDYDLELLAGEQGTWAVLGPFAGGMDEERPPEEASARGEDLLAGKEVTQTDYPNPYGTVLEGKDRPVRWERVRTDLWWLDLNALLMPKMHGPTCVQTVNGVAYLAAKVTSEREQRVQLLATFDDSLKVWANGERVFAGTHADNLATQRIPVRLRRGANTLLLKTNNTPNENYSAWCLSLRLVRQDGSPAPGVRYDALAHLPESLLLHRSQPAEDPPLVCTMRESPGNLARGKAVTADRELRWSGTLPKSAREGDPGQLLVDGDISQQNHVWTQGDGTPSWIQVDLGDVREVSRVIVWHAWGRSYRHNRVALSETGEFDGEEKVVFDSDRDGEHPEAPEGKELRFEKTRARYIRNWLFGASTPGANQDNHWVELEAYE